MPSRSGLLAPFLLALACCFACSSSPKPHQESAEATASDLTGGSPGQAEGSSALFIANGCTAVMIGANQLMTAAHCVVTQINGMLTTTLADGYRPNDSIAVTNSSTVGIFTSNWFVTTVVATDIHPDYASACAGTCRQDFSLSPPYAPDVAIVTLAGIFPVSFGLAALISSSPIPGDPIEEVGYGCEQGVGGPNPNPNRFKVAAATVSNLAGPMPASFQVTNIPAFSQTHFAALGLGGGGAASLCHGDSGGPVFKNSSKSALVGINSYYTFANGATTGNSDVNIFTRLDAATTSAWIARVLFAYPAPAETADRGDPINESFNPVSNLFPLSTVAVNTPGGARCTGEILSATKILTAAHCKVDSTTTVAFYATTPGAGPLPTGTTIAASSDAAVALQPDVVCDPDVEGSFPDTCYSGSGSERHYADLAVLTLASEIPAPYVPIALGPRGGFSEVSTPWEVATGQGWSMQWAPASYRSDSDSLGLFTMQATFGLPDDAGGPVYQYASDTGAVVPGTYNLVLAGVTSNIPSCAEGSSCSAQLNSYTSAAYPANYDWLMAQQAPDLQDVATFGASL
jgi:hypothetical protein